MNNHHKRSTAPHMIKKLEKSDFFCRPTLGMYLEKCEQNIVCKFIRMWSLQSTQLLGIHYDN